jgi:hypothetical protein
MIYLTPYTFAMENVLPPTSSSWGLLSRSFELQLNAIEHNVIDSWNLSHSTFHGQSPGRHYLLQSTLVT